MQKKPVAADNDAENPSEKRRKIDAAELPAAAAMPVPLITCYVDHCFNVRKPRHCCSPAVSPPPRAMQSFGVRLNFPGGKSLVYSGDCRPTPALVNLGKVCSRDDRDTCWVLEQQCNLGSRTVMY